MSPGQTGSEATHVPVMLDEAIEALAIRPGGVYVDGTLGGGGHSTAILNRLTGGLLVSLDRDIEAVEAFRRATGGNPNAAVVHGSFADLRAICEERGVKALDGVLYDLGLSSLQLAAGRGFSFHDTGLLDMRYDPDGDDPAAADLVNTESEQELARLFAAYDEPHARRIARNIARARAGGRIETAAQLVKAIGMPKTSAHHPATRVFLALRARVNGELEAIRESVPAALELLRPGGRVVVIAYHSAEDRIVKDVFRRAARGCRCDCPPDECICGFEPWVRLVTRRPVAPSAREVETNPRARSAKLRAAERI